MPKIYELELFLLHLLVFLQTNYFDASNGIKFAKRSQPLQIDIFGKPRSKIKDDQNRPKPAKISY